MDRKIPKYNNVDGLRVATPFPPDKIREVPQYRHQPNDLFLATFPKCGTNWTMQILNLILNKGEMSPECMLMPSGTVILDICGSSEPDNTVNPRLILTHMPPDRLQFSPQAKYIYVARNPKDCCVSFYYHTKSLPAYEFQDGTFDDYFEVFVKGENDFGDYFDHLLPWYARRNEPNVLFLTFENMKSDLRAAIVKIANFIHKDYADALEDEEVMQKILLCSSPGFMRSKAKENWIKLHERALKGESEMDENLKKFVLIANETTNLSEEKDYFTVVRKGVIGDWKNHFSPEQCQRMDQRIAEKTEGSDVMNIFKKYM